MTQFLWIAITLSFQVLQVAAFQPYNNRNGWFAKSRLIPQSDIVLRSSSSSESQNSIVDGIINNLELKTCLRRLTTFAVGSSLMLFGEQWLRPTALAEDIVTVVSPSEATITATTAQTKEILPPNVPLDVRSFRVPYNHENLEFGQFLGSKATIIFNMKIDDPQTVLQFPDLLEVYKRYAGQGLNIHAFPTEQVL